MSSDRITIIEASGSRGWRSLPELWNYRELVGILVWRDLKVRYRQTVLGALWVIGQPLISMVIFSFLFHSVARVDAGAIPYPLFVLSGLLSWNFFSSGCSGAGNSLVGASYLVSKVYFPRLAVPIAAIAVNLVDLAITLGMYLVMSFYYGVPVTTTRLLLLPAAMALVVIVTTGLGIWLSALNVEYRDVRVVVPFVLQLWMFATPVVYPASSMPLPYRDLADFNPATGLVELFRASLLGTPVSGRAVLVSVLVGLVVFVTGMLFFGRVERTMADVI